MRLFTSILPIPFAPNPRVVRMALAEKGLKLDLVDVDIRSGENRQTPFLGRNPAGEVPALELDNGTVLAESIAITEYLEELHPEPPLVGRTPHERALSRMWVRRVDFKVVQPLTAGFRAAEGLALFRDRVRCLPDAAEELKATARDGMIWFDAQLAERNYLGAAEPRLADILLYCFLDFGARTGQPTPTELGHLQAWFGRMAERPIAQAVDQLATQPA